MFGETTDKLTGILKHARPSDAARILSEYASEMTDPENGFSTYMRIMFRRKGLRQQDVFIRADISEGYGYKLISGEKRTKKRDTLLRLFFASGFTLEEADRALSLCRMPALYPRFPRDALLMIAFNSGFTDPSAVDDMLVSHGMEPLYRPRSYE